MGRLIPGPYSTNKNLTGTCAENLTDTFSYSSRAGSADNGPYVDVFRQLYNPKLNPRYNGKQFSSGTLHRAAGGVALRNTGAGLAGTCTQDNLRGPFIRGFEGDGYSGSGRPNLQGRDAFTNTVETERYREILGKELRVTDRQMKEQAIQKLKEFEEQRKNGPTELEAAMRKRRASRKYRPTSASAIGEGYNPEWGEDKDRNMTATLNEATLYTKPIPHFPSAYKCDNAHRPVIIADSDPGFFRRTVPSPIAWATKSTGTLSQIGNRAVTPGM